jgi:hypothetical protein
MFVTHGFFAGGRKAGKWTRVLRAMRSMWKKGEDTAMMSHDFSRLCATCRKRQPVVGSPMCHVCEGSYALKYVDDIHADG